MRIGHRARAIAAVIFVFAVSFGAYDGTSSPKEAWAQPKRLPRGTKPKPAPAVAPDAGAAETGSAPNDEPASAPALGGSASTGAASPPSSSPTDAGGAATPAPSPMTGDGGVRLSPLTPAANEFPAAEPPAGAPVIEYDKLLGDIAELRARVAAVGDNLFQSRLAVSVRTSGKHARVARLVIGLDDGAVYTAPDRFSADDAKVVYEHAVAPGKHAVTVDVERNDDRDEAFRTAQKSRFVVDVPKDHRLELEVRIDDDSTMGSDFPSDRDGKYDLRVRARASARPVKK